MRIFHLVFNSKNTLWTGSSSTFTQVNNGKAEQWKERFVRTAAWVITCIKLGLKKRNGRLVAVEMSRTRSDRLTDNYGNSSGVEARCSELTGSHGTPLILIPVRNDPLHTPPWEKKTASLKHTHRCPKSGSLNVDDTPTRTRCFQKKAVENT